MRGVAYALIVRAVEYLRSIGCTNALLHPSDVGGGTLRPAARYSESPVTA